jgi:hypothetical protein
LRRRCGSGLELQIRIGSAVDHAPGVGEIPTRSAKIGPRHHLCGGQSGPRIAVGLPGGALIPETMGDAVIINTHQPAILAATA